MPSGDTDSLRARAAPPVRLGLGANWRQFALLVLINAFVGGMVGLERAVLPLLAERDFGLTKAGANYLAGRLADRVGRRRVLLLGWLAALPVLCGAETTSGPCPLCCLAIVLA